MEKRGVFILMQSFLGPPAPFTTCRFQHVRASSEKATFTDISPGQKMGRVFHTVKKRKGWGTRGEKGNFISLCPPSLFPSLLSLAANQQEGSLPLAEGQVHRPLPSQCSVEWPSASAAILMRLSTSASRCFQHSLTWGMGTSEHFLTQVSLTWYN